MEEKPKLDIPDPYYLDTGGWSETSGYGMTIYLIPAAENDGQPRITTHGGVGNRGTPMLAWNNRWFALLSVGPGVVGQSLHDWLVGHTDEILALADTYQGSNWNGSNWIGSWGDDDDVDDFVLRFELGVADELQYYWDAADWLDMAPNDWVSLCADADVDPDSDRASAISAVVKHLDDEADQQGDHVLGIEDYVTRRAEDYDRGD